VKKISPLQAWIVAGSRDKTQQASRNGHYAPVDVTNVTYNAIRIQMAGVYVSTDVPKSAKIDNMYAFYRT
jgi:hypothetical protein